MSQSIRDKHRAAMHYYDCAMIARRRGLEHAQRELLLLALEAEEECAMHFLSRLDKEPTRSILFLSAASIAAQLGLWNKAHSIAVAGISDYTPAYQRDELHNLAHFIDMRRKKQQP